MLRQAVPADLEGICALWQEAFEDSEQAVRFFFQFFPQCVSYVAEEDGKIVSMVHALPQVLSPDTPAAYIYAVATLRSCRGKGLCRKLMAFAEEDLKRRGFGCCVLRPGEQSLFAFYRELGYHTAFTRRRIPFSGGTPIAVSEYLARRAELLREPHMVYDAQTLSYAQKVYGLTFYRTEGGIAAASPDYTAEVLPQDLEGERFAFGMVKQLSDKPSEITGFLGFALD